MGKKNKGKASKKGQGLAKTEIKTLKKDEKKTKKMLADAGEDDIENLIAKYKEEDKKRVEVIETKCQPPPPRVNMTLTAHPDKDELIMFGGEFFNGSKTFVYNDLYFYNCKKNEWTHVTSPNQPPPRCAHQAVALRQGGGQLWIFGGEFASPSQLQFYHYKELWVLHLKDKQWQKIHAPNGPSARSGHRMVAFRKQLIVFGGFHDNSRHYKYFNDVHAFNLETYAWTKLKVAGTPPAPRSEESLALYQMHLPLRSGCQFLSVPELNQIVVFGGYSKVSVKRDVDKGTVHMDMFTLAPQSKNKEETTDAWKWAPMKQSGCKPSPRSGLGGCVIGTNRAVLFGGVHDTEREEEDDDMEGSFFNTLYTLELDRGKWHETQLRGKREEVSRKRRKRRESGRDDAEVVDESCSDDDDDDDVDDTQEHIKKLKLNNAETDEAVVAMETTAGEETTYDDGIFSVTVGPAPATSERLDDALGRVEERFVPPKRMKATLVVQQGLLYLYGGSIEEGEKELTRTDMYSVDVRKMDEWRKLRDDESGAQEWQESDSEDSDENKGSAATGGEKESEDDDSDDDDSDDDDPPPDIVDGETLEDYYARTRTTFWLPLTKSELEEEGKTDVAEKKMEKIARRMAEVFFES